MCNYVACGLFDLNLSVNGNLHKIYLKSVTKNKYNRVRCHNI